MSESKQMYVASEVMVYQLLKDLMAEGLNLADARQRLNNELDEAVIELKDNHDE